MKLKILIVFTLLLYFYGFSQNTNSIDSLIHNSIKLKAFPGAQLYIKKGNFIYNKSYGYHTYDSINKLKDYHLFDLASLTKTIAGSLSIMKLVEKYDLDINSPISKYLTDFKRTPLGKSKIKDLLTHTAGWRPYISHHFKIIKKNGDLKNRFISKNRKNSYLPLTKNLYVKSNYINRIKKRIKKTKLAEAGNYNYSGLFFCLIPELVKNISESNFERFLDENFYNHLNNSITFNPLRKTELNNIVPTEIDSTFRGELVHGTVHDETAALMGGVSANAGLFASAKDLAKLLNNISKKNSPLINDDIFQLFTKNHIQKDTINNRGLGFDKVRYVSNGTEIYPHPKLSKESFGHTGFTGTMYWTDIQNDLIFVFLTNSVFPSRDKNTLSELEVRRKLLDLIL